MGTEIPEKHRVSRSREENRGIIASLIANARREIRVFAPVLDPFYFNTPAVEQSLTGFALTHPQNRVQLLIEDIPALLLDQARLVGLLRRLSDRIEIRRVDDDAVGQREFFVVADGRGYFHQIDYEGRESSADFDAAGEAALLVRRFEELWERSVRIPDLQTTGL
ncbi:MAG: hypothetical protein HY942_08000 [Gammaproteobacteria bacterium]|nr:hypothetical protein [Gammaproteobacteria bacterium]